MTATALRGRPSTDPRAVNRATNSTRDDLLACPEVVAYHQQCRDDGFRISLKGAARVFWIYKNAFDADERSLAYALTYPDPTGEQATRRALLDQLTNHRQEHP